MSTRNETVLVVDDDRAIARSLSVALNQFGLTRIETAAEWQEALDQVNTHRFDLVFLDINLVGHKGWELLEIIHKRWPGTFVVMFSGESTLDNVRKAARMGAGGFVVKPFSRDKVRDVLRKFDARTTPAPPVSG
ncbi:MAG: response regulator [Gammaproteobacteria bacterium]|nr:response regulator [Gammaproteobacteria bacterium]